MNWKPIIGRLIIATFVLILVLLFVFLAWADGIFDGYNDSERMQANFLLALAIGLLMTAGFVWTRFITGALIAAIVLSLAGIIGFSASDGWSDDLLPFLLTYPAMLFGYWLSRSIRKASPRPGR